MLFGGFFYFVVGFVFVVVGSCYLNVGDSVVVGYVMCFRIGVEIVDDDDFVDGCYDEFLKVIEVMLLLGLVVKIGL